MSRRKWFVMSILVLFVACGLFCYPSESNAQQKVLRYGHISPPHTTMGKTALFFKNYVEKNSKGSLKIEVYPLAQLGDARSMLEQVMMGTVDIAFVMSPVLGTLMPEYNVLNLPFLASNSDVMWLVLHTPEFRDRMDQVIVKKGMVPLFICDVIQRGFVNKKRPVRTPDDIKGLSMRVMEGPIYTDIFKALGAQTRTIPFGEVYTALQQGVIDAEDNTLAMAIAMKFVEVEKFYTPLGQTTLVGPVIGSQKMWKSLTDEQRRVMTEARANTEIFASVSMAEEESLAIMAAGKKYGVKVEEPLTAKELAVFREKTKPVYAKYRDIVGPDLFDQILRLTELYEKSRGR
ncbi:MAG: TRAP transporter substrate-binding protein [Deltaproteobacteria bacterium]|nr:TRAP transporter substrate-binding protein [Deltaproteobacteria bacterium]